MADDDALIRRVAEKSLGRSVSRRRRPSRPGKVVSWRRPAASTRPSSTTSLGEDDCGCDLIAPLRVSNPAIRIAVVSGLEVARHALAAGADIVASKTRIDWAALAAGDPPPPVVPAPSVVDLGALRREAIHGTWLVHGRNISHAARALGMTRSSLQRMPRKIPLPALDDEPEPTGSRK